MQRFKPEPFGKYFLVDKIATGGMAEIFKAKSQSHAGFEQLVVIKRILPHLGEKSNFVSMFVDEARVMTMLDHPNVVRVLEFGRLQDDLFIAMEHVNGKDVLRMMKKLAYRRAMLPPHLAAFIAVQMCAGLSYAHTRRDQDGTPLQLVHRDISPANILVSYEGMVKLADFGIAKAQTNAALTQGGMLKGKYEYMSPEQASGRPIEHWSDQFSTGIVLYEMLSGKRAFRAENEIATLKRIRDVQLPPLRRLNSRIPEELERICMRALSRRPEDRFASCSEMYESLREALLPRSDEALRAELAYFMQSLFEEDMEVERTRLRVAETVVKATHPGGYNFSDPMTEVTNTLAVANASTYRQGRLLVLLSVLVLVPVLISVILELMPGEPEASGAVMTMGGSIQVEVSPPARVYVDDVFYGEGPSIDLPQLDAGRHQVRLEADDYRTLEETVQVVSGGSLRFRRSLTPIVEPTGLPSEASEAPSSKVASAPVRLQSSPQGATIYIDDQRLATTPHTWRESQPGTSYQVEFWLDGHRPARFELVGPDRDITHRQVLNPDARDSHLRVLLPNGAWADVTLDGTPVDPEALTGRIQVASGEHTVHIYNPTFGLDWTETVRIAPGDEETIDPRTTP